MDLQYKVGEETLSLRIDQRDGGTVIHVRRGGESAGEAGGEGAALEIDAVDIDERFITLTIDGRTHRLLYARSGSHFAVAHRGRSYEAVPAEEAQDDAGAAAGGFIPEITSPMPGKVLEVFVAAGASVTPDQSLVLLEAMKMEQTVRAPTKARVIEVRVEAGAMIGPGAVLVVLEELEAD